MSMLETLTVKNFGIIESVSIELTPGLNILTGETGAGKSILIDALRFCLGERFQTSYLRHDGTPCTVEAVFDLSPDLWKKLECLHDFKSGETTLIIQRTVSQDGKNRVRLNGLTASVAQLKEIGEALIDFHGPHDHQQLLAEHHHLEIIDSLTQLAAAQQEYSSLYVTFCGIQAKIKELDLMAKSRERDLQLLEHQIKELEQVPLDEAVQEETSRNRIKISNAEKLYENISQAMVILENEDAGIELMLGRTFKPLQALAAIDEKSEKFLDQLSAVQDQAAELTGALRDYADSLSFDPGAAHRVNEQFDAYQSILRKYGPSMAHARRTYDEARQKFSLLNDFEHHADTLDKELKTKETDLTRLAKNMSQRRKKTADTLKKTIEHELQELGFKSIAFEARFEKKPLAADGTDKVVFFISTNAGEDLKPLAEIVSSGEAARIMLAVKRALMKADPVPVLIFDEIDAQIGGRLGTVIGTKLKEISTHRQVILITHLPQIAAFAQTHFKITKHVDQGRTRTAVAAIDGKIRVDELAHMMAGDKMTAAAMKHAGEMLKDAAEQE
ncbi:MAG: DNA repair protein RecN [Candidatus Omnitrophota bacterium]